MCFSTQLQLNEQLQQLLDKFTSTGGFSHEEHDRALLMDLCGSSRKARRVSVAAFELPGLANTDFICFK